MRVIDAISQILLKEGIEYLSAFPTTSVIEAAAEAGIKPIICRQERVGVGIADGYARINLETLLAFLPCNTGLVPRTLILALQQLTQTLLQYYSFR